MAKLNHVTEHSYGDSNTENMLIRGDNHLVLDILKDKLLGKIKCIYIDPPYNNQEKYTHYHDDTNHDIWLQNISKTLLKLKQLLSEDGSLWISIDDNEVHYLKVAADKVFGRKNFITTVIWQQRTSRENRKVFSNNHEYILVYARNPKAFKLSRNLLPATPEILARYKNPDNDPRGPWQSVSANVQAGHAVSNQFYELIAPNGKIHRLPNGRCWAYNKQRMNQEIAKNNIWFGKDGNGVPRIKKFLSQATLGVTPETLWLCNEVGSNKMAKKHLLSLFPEEPVFDTPKPEQLIQRILEISTNEGDIVLDAFLGSGTTSAVAQKLNRQYIGIEVGKHIVDLAVSRMVKVIQGEPGGISKEANWTGGGGYKFYQLEADLLYSKNAISDSPLSLRECN
ncbi:MAG: site-specific DNA-methyltransferase [Clostridiales bacterium]|jgi:adenine-specific DNA-methyltransferase|nr:site-specific DNA-methyltransferase [Clostridiales bacterium]